MSIRCLNPCGLACKPIPPTAPQSPILFLCGEGPGKDEVALRQFFVGKSGMEQDNYLRRAGVPKERVYVTNVLKCRTDNEDRDPTVSEIRACSRILLEELDIERPRFIAAVGRVSARFFLGDVDMEQVHGIPFRIDKVYVTGEWDDLGFETVVIPTYHPAAGLHDSTNMSNIMTDYMAVKATMMQKLTPRTSTQGKEYVGDYRVWDGSGEDLGSPIAIDTETSGGYKCWSVQFSCRAGSGLFIAADNAPLLGRLRDFTANPSVETVLHNALFDIPVLNTVGINPANYTDTMVMAYLLQTEPQGLKPLAFRHLGLKMDSYKDIVKPVTQQLALTYLLNVMDIQWPKVEPVVTFDGEKTKTRQPQTLNQRVRGILRDYAKDSETDLYERWNAITQEDGRWLADGMFGELGEAYLRDVDFPTALYYSCQDPDATLQLYPILSEKIAALSLQDVLARDVAVLPMIADMMLYGIRVDKEYLGLLSFIFRAEMDELLEEITKQVGPMNPGSNQQVFDLLRTLGFERRPTMYKKATDKGRMELLIGKHPVILPITQWKQYKTLIQNNIDVLPAAVQEDGRIHTHIRTTRVVTGRLATSDPNLLAQPVRSTDGKKIRNAFISQEGYTFLAGDYAAVEMRVAADQSKDAVMMDIFMREGDVHTETAMKIFDKTAEEVLADEMKYRYPSKRIGFGVLYGVAAPRLQRELEIAGIHWTEQQCQQLIYDWFGVYQGIRDWMEGIKSFAKQHGYVRDMWGRIRLAPELLSVHKQIVEAGERQSCNAMVQMPAQGIIKEAMRQLVPIYKEYNRWEDPIHPIIQIHDDLMWEIRDDVIDEFKPVVQAIMEGAAPMMTTPLRVDFKRGKRWGEMTKWKEEKK